MNLSLPDRLTFAPGNISGDGLTFRLGKGAQHGDQHFAVHVQGVDVLFLKDHTNAHCPKHPGVVDGIQGVPCESGDGLGQNQVYLFGFAPANHPIEIVTLFGGCACDALVSKNPRHSPLGVGHDFIRIVGTLSLVAGLLFFLLCGNPAVGSNPKLPLHSLPLCQWLCGN